MSYKYSNDYDDIIDVKADAEFIWNLHLLEQNIPYNVIWEQMRRIYELECQERKLALMPARGQESWYEEEYHLNYRIQNRAEKLIEAIKIRYIATTRRPNDPDIADMLKEYDQLVVDETISVLRSCLFLFDVKGSNVLFGKERDIERYKALFRELTSAQPELQEQGKQKLFPPLSSGQK